MQQRRVGHQSRTTAGADSSLVSQPSVTGTVYTCPMHPEIRQDHPGTCPKCGMSLEPVMPSLDQDEDPELREFQPHMQSSLVKDAMAMAWWRRRPEPGAIFHSDRGSQYCSQSFQAALAGWGIRSSMSRKGNCWDNSPIESFWGRLKTACVHGQRFATREHARQAIMNWMAFYNYRRLHSSLGYLSPMQYEQRWYEAQRKKAA